MQQPSVAITLGDVTGIGPEVVVRACVDEKVRRCCRPVVVGDAGVVERAMELVGVSVNVKSVDSLSDADHSAATIVCYCPSDEDVSHLTPGRLDARAGRAAHEYLTAAAAAALDGAVDAVVTAPINKESLRLAGMNYPGHTEILAEQCGVENFAMMLHLPAGEGIVSPFGLSVVHVTLHTSLQSVPGLLSQTAVAEKIDLVGRFLEDLGCETPRIGVCALNPHAGENGLFGDEEQRIIQPAVEAIRTERNWHVAGPLPADTLIRRAVAGEFDALVAIYHDQGHIPFKLLGFDRAVNITLGLPITRTSPSHGTAFDIAWQGRARAEGMVGAIQVAVQLAQQKSAGRLSC